MCGMDRIAAKIRSARKARGLTQRELADKVGIDQGFLSRVERGEKGLTTDGLRRVCQALDIPVAEVLGDETPASGIARKIIGDDQAPDGLKELARDTNLSGALQISGAEWETLRSIDLPPHVSKDGYVQLLITIRTITGR